MAKEETPSLQFTTLNLSAGVRSPPTVWERTVNTSGQNGFSKKGSWLFC